MYQAETNQNRGINTFKEPTEMHNHAEMNLTKKVY